MKKLNRVILSVFTAFLLFFTACDQPKQVIEQEHTGWDQGQKVFTDYTYSPDLTWSEAFKYAFKSGYEWYLAAAALLLIVLGIYTYLRAVDHKILGSDESFFYKRYHWIAFIFLVAIASLVHHQPADIRFQNNKKITVVEFEKNKEDGFKSFNDSLFKNNQLIGAANPDFK